MLLNYLNNKMNFWDTPAYKVEVKDIRQAIPQENDEEGGWTLTLHSKDLVLQHRSDPLLPDKEVTLNLSLVWLQGTVVDTINNDADPPNNLSVLRFTDATGEAQVDDYLSLPGVDSSITKGAYIAVIGQISTNKPRVNIKGAKIMNLENTPSIKAMWSEEILMDRAFLLGLIEPDIKPS